MSEEAKIAVGLPLVLLISYGWYRLGSWYEEKYGHGTFDEAVIVFIAIAILSALALAAAVMWMFCVLKSLGLLS